MTPKEIAEVCHEANRALTRQIGDVPVQPPWAYSPEEMIRSSVRGVVWRLDNPDAPASAQHDAWVTDKLADGWKFGAVKDSVAKTHPALIPYARLVPGVRLKDACFTAIVRALSSEVVDPHETPPG